MSTNRACFKSGMFLITLIPSTICMVIVVWIYIKSINQLKNKPKIESPIKILYHIASILSICVITFCFLGGITLCFESENSSFIPAFIVLCLYMGIGCCVLAILLIRVHFTFKESIFKLSKCEKYSFIILYSMTILSVLFVLSVQRGMDPVDLYGMQRILYTISAYCLIIFFSITTIYGIFIFVLKMYKLTRLRRGESTKLTQQQMKLLNIAAKYISLLGLAIFTTWITFILILMYAHTLPWNIAEIQLFLAQFAIECAVNVICLYLQYPFAKKYYYKYCECFGRFWRNILVKKVERAIQLECSESTKDKQTIQIEYNHVGTTDEIGRI